MLSQIFSVIIRYMLGQTSSDSPGFLHQLTMGSLRKMMMIMAGVVVGLIVFFSGAFTVLMDMILSSRDHGQLMLSSVSIVGFSLMGISVLSLAVLFRRKIWRRSREATQSREQAISQAIAPVANAVASLINDFAEERKRMMMAQSMSQAPTAFEPEIPDSAPHRPSVFN